MHKRILVTGGAGFAGSRLCLALRRHLPDTAVTAFDNLHRRGSERNLAALRAAGVCFVHGDVRLLSDLQAAAIDADLLIECSAEPSAQAGYSGSPDFLMATNVGGAVNCLEIARVTRCDVLFLSTSRVYPYRRLNELPFIETETRYSFGGTCPGLTSEGISEDFPLDGVRSLYGTTKLAAELMLEEYAAAYGFRFIIDRFGVITGPGQMAKADQGVIALWVAAHRYGRPLRYIGFEGKGKQVRDFLHVDDFCDLVLDQIDAFAEYAGGRYNAGGGFRQSLSLAETTELCRSIVGHEIPIGAEAQNRAADVRIYITDNSRVSGVRGWRPKIDAAQTISDIDRWLVDSGKELENIIFGAA
jgi:CDP-paratose 2-epimerase